MTNDGETKSPGPLIPGLRTLRGCTTLLLVLGVLVAASYLPALWGEFVWDDFLLMKLKAVSSWDGIGQLWFDPATAYLQRDAVEGHYWPLAHCRERGVYPHHWDGIGQLWFDPATAYLQRDAVEGHYWPLLYTTFWMEHKLWGFHPLGYHAVNLLLHFVNTALLWRLLLLPGAWFYAWGFPARGSPRRCSPHIRCTRNRSPG